MGHRLLSEPYHILETGHADACGQHDSSARVLPCSEKHMLRVHLAFPARDSMARSILFFQRSENGVQYARPKVLVPYRRLRGIGGIS